MNGETNGSCDHIVPYFCNNGGNFFIGKGSFLIAGYNTADKKEKEKYDEKKLNLCFACFSFGMAAVIGACGYMDTEAFAVQVGLPAIIALVIFVFIATNTFCKKK